MRGEDKVCLDEWYGRNSNLGIVYHLRYLANETTADSGLYRLRLHSNGEFGKRSSHLVTRQSIWRFPLSSHEGVLPDQKQNIGRNGAPLGLLRRIGIQLNRKWIVIDLRYRKFCDSVADLLVNFGSLDMSLNQWLARAIVNMIRG